MMRMESIGPREWPQNRKLPKSQDGKQQGIKLSDTRQAKDDVPPAYYTGEPLGRGHTARLGRPFETFEHVTKRDGDFQVHLHHVFSNPAPKPSPEARRLDAIRAVYDAADEGNKVQSALSHAREIAADIGEIEPANRLSVLFGLIKSAQAECAEIARELAVSGK